VRKLTRLWAASAAAAITPALAQDVPTVIYGTLNVDVERVEATGAAPALALPAGSLGFNPNGVNVPARNRVTQNSSNLGFRGGESLGPALSAFWQVESGVAVDSGGSSIASRNTAVGLSGAFGSVRAGQWDTPFKTLSGAVDPMYFTGITYTGAIIGTPGFGVGPVTIGGIATSGDGKTYAAAANASFERRQGNIVQYWLPAIAGVTTRLAYSVNEGRTAKSDSATQVNPQIYSGSVEYDLGMFFIGYAYELHEDYFGLDALVPAVQATPVSATAAPAASSRDKGHKLVGRVKVGATTLGVMADRLSYAKSQGNALPGAFSRYQRRAIAFTWLHRMGAHTIRGFYAKAQDGSCSRFDGSACDTRGLGARQLSIGYSYTFSARTDLYVFHTEVRNDARASYQFANAAGIGSAPGAQNRGLVLGIRHTF
jgi:predicted porin